MEASGVRIQHPNRDKPASKATKAGVVLLLVASAALIAIVLIGGYSEMQGAEFVAGAWVILYAIMAYFVARWNRGILPLAAGLAIVFASFAVVAAPAWLARDKPGLDDPLLPSGLLGLLVLVLIGVQILLILFSMRGFQQQWNVEVEVSDHDRGDGDEYDRRGYETGGSQAATYDEPATREHERADYEDGPTDDAPTTHEDGRTAEDDRVPYEGEASTYDEPAHHEQEPHSSDQPAEPVQHEPEPQSSEPAEPRTTEQQPAGSAQPSGARERIGRALGRIRPGR